MTAGGIMDQKTLLDVEPIHGRRLPERIGRGSDTGLRGAAQPET